MAAFPATLPGFEAGLRETWQSSRVRTPTDTGPGKQRNRFSAAARYLTGSILLTTVAQRATWDTFYETTLDYGVEEFTMTDPRDASTVNARLFGDPEYEHLAGEGSGTVVTRVTLRIEILP